MTLTELIDNAFAVRNGMMAYYPAFDEKEAVVVEKEPDKTFCSNNSVLAFVFEGTKYIVPDSEARRNTLVENGFIHKEMNVPFSSGSHPDLMDDWIPWAIVFAEHGKHESFCV